MFEKVLGYIEYGKNGGARCVAGGGRIGDKGYFVQPTVFADVQDDMKIAKEEVRIIIHFIKKVSGMGVFLCAVY